MICKPLLPGINTMGGDGMKRSLLYDSSTSRIDIFVRESIQNSFDALNEDAEFLEMHYNHGTFKTCQLASELDCIGDSLNEKFSEECEFLEFRDVGTVGLNGPMETINRDKYGKLMNLVYSVADKQEGSGKGGSWGYGKTNYYNVGVGLVIYYTRTVFEGKYQQRLVAVLVEDNTYRADML